MTAQCLKVTFLLLVALLIIAFPLSTALRPVFVTAVDVESTASMGQQTTVVSPEPVQATTSIGPCFGMFCALQTEDTETTGG